MKLSDGAELLTTSSAMDQPGVEAIWQAERDLLSPSVRRDGAAVERLLAADFHEIGQSGTHWTREQVIDALAGEQGREVPFEIWDVRVDFPAAGLALLTYRLDFGCRLSQRSSLWRVSAIGPQLLFHHGTPIGSGAGN